MKIIETGLTERTLKYNLDSEQESERVINYYKDLQLEEGFSVVKTKVDYKVKKDKKTGEITEETWVTLITVSY